MSTDKHLTIPGALEWDSGSVERFTIATLRYAGGSEHDVRYVSERDYDAALAASAWVYDESKERELFEEWADEKGFCLDCKFFEAGNNFEDQATKWLYEAWLACAKSRTRSAE